MSNSKVLQNPEKAVSQEACSDFLNELVKSPILGKIKPVDYPYNNLNFVLMDISKPIYTYIHLIDNENNITKFYSPIRIYDNHHKGLIIEILDEKIKSMSGGFISFNSDFILMKYNRSLYTLEFDICYNSVKTKVLIFSHFFTE